MSLDRRIYSKKPVFLITSSDKTKPVFRISDSHNFSAAKRTAPFHVPRSVLPSSPLSFTRPPHTNGSPLFSIVRHKSRWNKSIPVPRKVSPMQSCDEDGVRRTGGGEVKGCFETRMEEIAGELQAISQELDADYDMCKNALSINPMMLNYWINLHNCTNTLRRVTQDISQIPRANYTAK